MPLMQQMLATIRQRLADFAAFNHGEYFEQHEFLEEAWKEAQQRVIKSKERSVRRIANDVPVE